MDNTNKRSYPQMNVALKSAVVNLAAEPEARRAAYRAVLRLLRYSFPADENEPLAKALNYENAETLTDDMNALARIILQVQQSFGEAGIAGFWYEDDTDAPAKDCGPDRSGAEEREMNAAQELKAYATAELAAELERREGVETHWVEPYASTTVKAEGPAVVFVVID